MKPGLQQSMYVPLAAVLLRMICQKVYEVKKKPYGTKMKIEEKTHKTKALTLKPKLKKKFYVKSRKSRRVKFLPIYFASRNIYGKVFRPIFALSN
jgi:hypothetical protein